MPFQATWIILIVALAVLAFLTGVVLHRYIPWSKDEWYTPVLTYVGWFFAISVALLVPLDIASSAYLDCITESSSSSASDAIANLTNASASSFSSSGLDANSSSSSSSVSAAAAHAVARLAAGAAASLASASSSSSAAARVMRRCHAPMIVLPKDVFILGWAMLYWSAFFLCWIIYPFMQSYVTAADFTVLMRWRQSFKENIIFYGLCGVGGVAFVVAMIFWRGLGIEDLINLCMMLANAWGLLLLILLLSYGLVEIPRSLWRQGNYAERLQRLSFDATPNKESVDACKENLMQTLEKVRQLDLAIDEGGPFRPHIDTVVRKCPPMYTRAKAHDKRIDITYKNVVNVHYQLIWQKIYLTQAQVQFDTLLNEAYKIEDILKAKQNRTWAIRWSNRSAHCGKMRSTATYAWLEYLFYVYLRGPLLRVLSLLCAALSLVIVWSECTFMIRDPVLSVFAIIANSDVVRQSDMLLTLIFFVPLTYIVVCAYWSTFSLRLFRYYRLLPNQQTDGNSIMFSAALLCRVAAPLALNFLLIHRCYTGTSFEVVMAGMKKMLSWRGWSITEAAPLLLLIFCPVTLFSLGTRCARLFHIRRFDYSADEFDESQQEAISEGRHVVAAERERICKDADGCMSARLTDGVELDQTSRFSTDSGSRRCSTSRERASYDERRSHERSRDSTPPPKLSSATASSIRDKYRDLERGDRADKGKPGRAKTPQPPPSAKATSSVPARSLSGSGDGDGSARASLAPPSWSYSSKASSQRSEKAGDGDNQKAAAKALSEWAKMYPAKKDTL
eukprot:m51a1_g9067 hypothetical protein (789) ;mRNA; f:91909-94699